MRVSIGLAASLLGLILAASPALANTESASGDFNGDGHQDIAFANYLDTVGSAERAGSVTIRYGSETGLFNGRQQILTQNTVGMPGVAEKDDRFGFSVASADFNGDGITDLAIAAVREDLEGGTSSEASGAVHVIYGTTSGLSLTGPIDPLLITARSPLLAANVRASDTLGTSLAGGNFNGSGGDDLAIGLGGGTILLIRGTEAGLSLNLSRRISASDDTVGGNSAQDNVAFGRNLVSADFNGDSFTDLAVSADRHNGTNADGDTQEASGAVYVLYGSAGGLAASFGPKTGLWTLGDLEGAPDKFSLAAFGSALDAGDFNGDGNDDLIVGAPGITIIPAPKEGPNRGLAVALYGSNEGITAANATMMSSRNPAGTSARFGSSVYARELNGDRFADALISGVEAQNFGFAAVTAVVGSELGLLPFEYLPLSAFLQVFPQDRSSLRVEPGIQLQSCAENPNQPQCQGFGS